MICFVYVGELKMLIDKWNENINDYQKCEVPDDWHLPLISDNMDEIINCVNCGKQIAFGDGYTSHRYHNSFGFGYYECESCYFDYLPIHIASKSEELENY